MYNILPVNSFLQLPLHLYLPVGKSIFLSVSFYAFIRGGKDSRGCVGKAKHFVTNLHRSISKIFLQILEICQEILLRRHDKNTVFCIKRPTG